MIRGTTDEHFWSETYDREIGDALALEGEVAQAIAGRVEVTITGVERARLVAARQVSPEVYESVLKGQHTGNYSQAAVEKSISYFEEAIKRDPSFAPAYVGLANAYPIPVLEKAVVLSGRSPAVIGVLVRAYPHAGRRTEAVRLLDELKRRQRTGYDPSAAFVNAYLGLGDNEQAFAWLERAYQEHSAILQYVKVHPFFDPLRGDPRFADLVRRVGLDQAW